MAPSSRAWVLDVGAGQRAAAGAPHVVEYLLATETVPVPRTPRHCHGLLFWRERTIPVLDLAPLIAEGATAATATRRAVVLAWQERPGEALQYGALLVTAAPGETWVSDDMAGDLADAPAAFNHFARAGFMDKDRLIPILDLRRLFGRPLPAELLDSDATREHDYRFDEAAFAADGAFPHRAVAEGIPTWRTLSNDIDLPALQPAMDTPDEIVPDEMPLAGLSAVVIPFSTGKAEIRQDIFLSAEPEEVPGPVSEAPITGESLAPDEQSTLTTELEAVETGLWVDMEPSPTVPIRDDTPTAMGPRSRTIESFERLRALKEKAMPLARDGRLRRRVIVIVLVLAGLSAAYLTIAYYLSSGVAAPGSAVRDAAPGGIDPHSIPVTPAQPPK